MCMLPVSVLEMWLLLFSWLFGFKVYAFNKVGNGRTRGNRTDGVPVWGLAAWKPLGKVWVFS